jgi:hypothetical protein
MALITSTEPFQLRYRRRRRRTLSSSLALTGIFLLVLAVLQNIASIVQTRRYLSQIVLEEENRIVQRGISLHNVVRLEQGMTMEQMASLAHGDEEEEDHVIYNRPTQKELEEAAHEMEHGVDEMTLYGLAPRNQPTLRRYSPEERPCHSMSNFELLAIVNTAKMKWSFIDWNKNVNRSWLK